MLEQEDIIRLDGQEFLRVPVRARLRATSLDELPEFVHPISTQATAASKKQMYWQDAENPDVVWTSFVLDTEGVNKNWDYMPRSQLLKSFQTARYKPMDMEHIVVEEKSMVGADKQHPPVRNTIFGVMTNVALCNHEGRLLTDKQIANLETSDKLYREDDEKVAVVAWAAMFYFLFPETVKQLVKTIEAGNMFVSMERWLKKYDFLVADGERKYHAVSKEDAEKNGIAGRWMTRQTVNSVPVLRRTLTYCYGGVASTVNPANELSRFIGQNNSGRTRAAAAIATDPGIQQLNARHDEIVRLFAMCQDDAEREQLADEHTRIHRAVAAYLG